MIADLMVWHLGDVLYKYLDLDGSSEIGLYLDNMLTCGSNAEFQNTVMVADLGFFHLSDVLAKYLRSELIMAREMVCH